MTELPSEEAVETVDENGWTHRRCEGSVPENSKVVGGVLCRYWHEEEPEGVRLINSLDQVAPLLARIAELEAAHKKTIQEMKSQLRADILADENHFEIIAERDQLLAKIAKLTKEAEDTLKYYEEKGRVTVARDGNAVQRLAASAEIAIGKLETERDRLRIENRILKGKSMESIIEIDEDGKVHVPETDFELRVELAEQSVKRLEAELVEARRVTDLLNTQNVLLMERATVKEGSQ